MIPFLDLVSQHHALKPELLAAAERVLASARFTLGDETTAFETAFAEMCGARHAIAVNTGTSALHLALLAAGVGPGDEVITTPATFIATVAAIEYAGATPRLVDIDPATWTLDAARIEAAVTPRTKAVMPVHLHGRLADMAAISQVARAHGLRVIEDAAQAHGAGRLGQRAGALGDIAGFSFYPGKNLGACGEGGCVTTNDDGLAAHVRRLRDWGQSQKYRHVEKGFNYRLDEIQAAMLNVKLPHLADWTAQRRHAAARYDRNLDAAGIARPVTPQAGEHVYHVYAVRVANRDAVLAGLAPEISANIHYPTPVHLQPAYADLGYERGDFPIAEQLADETLSLPLFPGITDAQVDRVCEAVVRLCRPVAQSLELA